MDLVRVFIGFDARETIAFHVASQSIHHHSSLPVSITPLKLEQLARFYHRPRDPLQATDFAFSRFLTPALCGFEGWALFVDCDVLFRDDIAALWELRDERYAVQVVQHSHVPREERKFLGQPQTIYPRKNWSSLMLFNNVRCKALTPEYVATASGLDLHRFRWLESDDEIGALPPRWNHLVDYDPEKDGEKAANLHFTHGGPWFASTRDCGFANEWRAELRGLLDPVDEPRLADCA